MPKRQPLPEGTISLSEAAAILGVSTNWVSRWRRSDKLGRPTDRKDGRCWRDEVEALAAEHARQAEDRRRPTPRPLPELPPDQDAASEELMPAAGWTSEAPGLFVDSYGGAEILGVTSETAARMAAEGWLPWLPTGRLGDGTPRVYRRAQIEVIARARQHVPEGRFA